jgi:predicted RNA-binding protein (virulence factor B family)
MVGQFAFLRVVSVNPRIGVFLDWGLEKDLLLPIREQTQPLRAGDWLVVHIAHDARTDRIIASARLNRYLNLTPSSYAEGQPVELLVFGESPLGYNVIVEQKHRGLLYRGDLPEAPAPGTVIDGFVRVVREDGKIDVTVNPPRVGFGRIVPVAEKITDALKAAPGQRLALHDNSPPEDIRAAFGVSKKAFKQAIGVLFKAGEIVIEKTGIRLAPPEVKGKEKVKGPVKAPGGQR